MLIKNTVYGLNKYKRNMESKCVTVYIIGCLF